MGGSRFRTAEENARDVAEQMGGPRNHTLGTARRWFAEHRGQLVRVFGGATCAEIEGTVLGWVGDAERAEPRPGPGRTRRAAHRSVEAPSGSGRSEPGHRSWRGSASRVTPGAPPRRRTP